MIGLYHPGASVLHRLPAGVKLLAMLAGVIVIVLLHHPWQIGVAALAVAALFAVARIPVRLVWSQLRPMRWFLVIIVAAQLIVASWQQAIMVAGGLLVSVALAALVTLTTRVTAMLDVCQRSLRPLRRVGLDPDRVGLVLALTIRCVPLMVGIVDEVAQARKARGAGFSLTALATPVVVRALRAADQVGDALIARGVDD